VESDAGLLVAGRLRSPSVVAVACESVIGLFRVRVSVGLLAAASLGR